MLQYEIIVVTPFSQNCTLLWDDDSKEGVLIDAGGDIPLIESKLVEKNITLTQLWVTHGHLDHVGAVSQLAEKYKVPIMGPHSADDFWLKALPMQSQMFNFPLADSFSPNQWLNHGDNLSLGQYEFEVRFTPGHTPGHVIIYSKDLNLLWTGDVLFKGSIGRTDFPQGDYDTLINSINEQVFTYPDETQFICGHGEMSTIGHEKQFNPFLAGKHG